MDGKIDSRMEGKRTGSLGGFYIWMDVWRNGW
jgi:hypothetical protein